MRIHCKIVAIAICFGVFLLLYFFGGNAADEPPLKEVAKEKHFSFSRDIEDIAPVKEAKQTHEEPQIPPKPIRKTDRREPKLSSRGGNVSAKTGQKSEMGRPGSKVTRAEDVMHLAVVACGNRLDETLTMVKSALLFSIKKIKFHIFAEEDLAEQFEKGSSWWRSDSPQSRWRRTNLRDHQSTHLITWLVERVTAETCGGFMLFPTASTHNSPRAPPRARTTLQGSRL